MAYLFRSEDMQYVSITMTNDSAHDTISEIGTFGKLHVVDLNSTTKEAPSRQLQSYKKRLADATFYQKKLSQFADEVARRHISMPTHDLSLATPIKSADVIRDCDAFLEPIERELVLSENFSRDNKRQMNEIIERIHVLTVCASISIQSEIDRLREDNEQRRGSMQVGRTAAPAPGDEDKFRSFLCGSLLTASQDQFKRMLYRVSRGNAFVRFEAIKEKIQDPSTDESVEKCVFYIVFLGLELKTRIMKMCDVLRATLYELHTENRSEIGKMIENLQVELVDKRVIHTSTEEQMTQLLTRLVWNESTSPLNDWLAALQREKLICDVFMKSHFYLTMIAIEGWVPSIYVDELKDSVKNAVLGSRNPAAAIEVEPANPIHEPGAPPTFFRTNKFTATYQGIVDTYGVPRYKEANPALFTIISFPFLFGVMYGDIGHGLFLFLFSLFMILGEKGLEAKRKAGTLGEIPTMAFGGRYVMILMGAFGIYAGTVYNDTVSIKIAAFPTTWSVHPQDNSTFVPNYAAGTYPWGIDWNWGHTSNELAFYNSMKMKMAVIFGVTQMFFGVCLSLSNHLYFRDRVSVYFEFLPRIIFLLCTFGYMDFMILLKWSIDWENDRSVHDAPNLIQTMIGMFLGMGKVPEGQKPLYPGQSEIQLILLLLAVFSVPVMLLGKPLIENAKHKKEKEAALFQRRRTEMIDDLARESELVTPRNDNAFHPLQGAELTSPSSQPAPHAIPSRPGTDKRQIQAISSEDVALSITHAASTSPDAHEEHSLSDSLIHNSIHTIEYVLGTVSNTASYLRLWALSLAHAELAEVFWSKMLQDQLTATNPIFLFIGYAVWAAATFAVLLAMDVLECFLHALRLHWVEFQNKFFYADGKAFEPFNYTEEAKSQ